MEPKDTLNKIKEQEQSKLMNSNNIFKNIKSKFIIKKFFDYIHKRKTLEIIKCNKNNQKRMNINIIIFILMIIKKKKLKVLN